MIVEFEEYQSVEKYKTDVLNILQQNNTTFKAYKEGYDSLIIFDRQVPNTEKQPLFFVFLKYTRVGNHTHLATLEQALNNEHGKPRQSSGEWVVETIFQTKNSDANSIFKKIEDLKIQEKVIPFIKEELYRF